MRLGRGGACREYTRVVWCALEVEDTINNCQQGGRCAQGDGVGVGGEGVVAQAGCRWGLGFRKFVSRLRHQRTGTLAPLMDTIGEGHSSCLLGGQ